MILSYESDFYKDEYIRKATVRNIVDGDTLDVMVDMGFRRFSVERVRIMRINTPEIKGVEREEGLKSKAYVESVIPVGTEVVIQSFKGDAFGRWLAEILYTNEEGDQVNLSDELLRLGYAVEYKG